jgi:hypothetical protein
MHAIEGVMEMLRIIGPMFRSAHWLLRTVSDWS